VTEEMESLAWENLTGVQRDLLRSAVREGYFEVPRKITMVELADEHGLSSGEAVRELHRGLDVVLRDAFQGN